MTQEQLTVLNNFENDTLVINDKTIDVLNELLVISGHYLHQQIAKTLQDVKSPSTIPFVKRALDSGFGYLEYTCSEPQVIAKWFSWILFEIGTDASINLMEQYANSSNEAIRSEMVYRLSKFGGQ